MKSFISVFCFAFISQAAWGGLAELQIKNFRGQFSDPRGSATAERFDLPEKTSSIKAVHMTVERQGDGYLFNYDGEEIVWSNPPAFIGDVETLKWNGIFVTGKSNGVRLGIPLIETTAEKGGGTLKGLTANCGSSKASIESSDILDGILTSCISRGTVRLESFKGNKDKASNIDVEKVKFDIRNGKLTFEARVDIGSSMKVTGNGSVTYSRSKNEMKLKIDRVKAGILNVTGKVFKELKKLESDQISVNRPYITISLKK